MTHQQRVQIEARLWLAFCIIAVCLMAGYVLWSVLSGLMAGVS